MPQFIIECTIPGADTLSHEELADITTKQNEVVAGLDVPDTWITSYVAGDKIYCVHETDDPETIYEHGRRGGFPVDSVTPVENQFGPNSSRTLVSPARRSGGHLARAASSRVSVGHGERPLPAAVSLRLTDATRAEHIPGGGKCSRVRRRSRS